MNEEHSHVPSEHEIIERQDQRTEEKTVGYAGFWIRFWAYLVDLIIVSSLTGILLVPFYLLLNVNELTWGVFTLGGFLSTVTAFGYFTLMTKYFRQTLGKLIFGIKVYSYENSHLSWLDVVFREIVGRFIHQSLVFTNLLYLIVPFSSEKRGIHDRLGHTFVGLEPRKGKVIRTEEEDI
ncbi:hypothetical protein CR194_11455 [Salipaludibacillus keqinensis]|uniref:RDD domain-containing protein n=1 Tax=Salipaludibacillus keqinensis TaxID=2045207 RepID=A0A323TM84_9BACI|nr:RDD family protein [Salipaludibacillus keqinensis]PYZ93763.1 hypothetical protein CR194_11455 [Salipaludibacillus keqinensis]